MTKRKPPARHLVRAHARDGKKVESFLRGHGNIIRRKSKRVSIPLKYRPEIHKVGKATIIIEKIADGRTIVSGNNWFDNVLLMDLEQHAPIVKPISVRHIKTIPVEHGEIVVRQTSEGDIVLGGWGWVNRADSELEKYSRGRNL